MRIYNLVILAFILSILVGCRLFGFYSYNSYGERIDNKDAKITVPTNVKKKKRNIQPTITFIESIKDYRNSRKHFPQDMWDLENFNAKSRNAFNDMREIGFKKLDIDYVYIDSFVLHFVHIPVYKQQIGTYIAPGQDISGRFIFTYKDSSFSYTKQLIRSK